ncbi:hypothetical protein PINS_up011083 [Pythium insidiosum]|nr:hypothetical protein PINS_up011083 [Pythium insidiosum]
MTAAGFSMGISPEQKLSMPLDDLIKKAKKNNPKRAVGAKTAAATPNNGAKRKQQSVKKTVTVPIAKSVRAKAMQVVSSNKRQAVMNKRRAGLVVAPQSGKRVTNGVAVQLRRRKTSALDAARSKTKQQKTRSSNNYVANSSGIDVSGIERHFRTHPTKFNLPKGTNLRITISTNKIKPVVGAKKK